MLTSLLLSEEETLCVPVRKESLFIQLYWKTHRQTWEQIQKPVRENVDTLFPFPAPHVPMDSQLVAQE